MGKNTKGGSGHKKMGKKFLKPMNFSRRIREPVKGEMLAKVTNVNGGAICEVYCNDKVARQMVIRNKFRGRNKRDNNVSIGTIVLVGLRDWQVLNGKKKEKVDLLYVYNSSQMEEIKKIKGLNNSLLPEGELVEENNPFD